MFDLFSTPLFCTSGQLTSYMAAMKETSGRQEPNRNIEVRALNDVVVSSSERKVAVVALYGMLTKEWDWGTLSTKATAALLQSLELSGEYEGIVLDIHSGGGYSTAIAPMVEYLQNKKMPVYANVDIAASAAYWIAMYCDAIHLNNPISAGVGSIGVYTQVSDFNKFYENMGISIHEVYSSKSADKNKSYREVLNSNYKPIIAELDQQASFFQESVKSCRPQVGDNALTGAMFYGEQAIAMGLADGIKTLAQTVSEIQSINNLKQIK